MLLKLHIVTYFIGVAAFFLAAILSLAVLLQDYSLKQKKLVRLSKHLPSLESVERWVRALNLWGFPSITLGLVLGFVLAHERWHGQWATDPKVLLALLCWLWYACILSFRFVVGWRGTKLAWLNLAGFIVVIASMLVEMIFSQSLHRVI